MRLGVTSLKILVVLVLLRRWENIWNVVVDLSLLKTWFDASVPISALVWYSMNEGVQPVHRCSCLTHLADDVTERDDDAAWAHHLLQEAGAGRQAVVLVGAGTAACARARAGPGDVPLEIHHHHCWDYGEDSARTGRHVLTDDVLLRSKSETPESNYIVSSTV